VQNTGAADGARVYIERGLACYGRGELKQALAEWQEALRIDPENYEAQKLVRFVQERLSGSTGSPRSVRRTPTMLDAFEDEKWNADEGTSPESIEETAERLREAEEKIRRGAVGSQGEVATPLPEMLSEGTAQRPRRNTLVSALPAILAPSTRSVDDERTTPPRLASVPDPVDDGDSSDRRTREVAVYKGSRDAGATMPPRADTPLDIALAHARVQGERLVHVCQKALSAGKFADAAAAADEAVEESEKAPMPGIAEIVDPARAMFEEAFRKVVGPLGGIPEMAADMKAVNANSFDHRTGFLLSCIDGTLPIETLIDISGMGRFEALRTLSRLLRRKLIRLKK
jgi:tetratricopeptide (TPR) repeat protein